MFRLSWFIVGMFLGCCMAIAAATQAREGSHPSSVASSPVTAFLQIARGR
ncbi:MAG TPA: hypothetical protein PLD73_05640 [Candidatus Hydrogenedentes bacterium]|nr:hypothetical protein [Candidatus Hydrogenedentota bacterium]